MSPIVVLVGAPGSGKTTVGRAIASALDCEFRDTDADVEQAAGKPIADIFVESGEAAFRELETTILQSAIQESSGVLSLGGGTVLRDENRALLAGQPVVWLDVTLSDAVERVGLATARPVLVGNVRGRMMELLQQRAPMYEAVAMHRVSTHQKKPSEIAQEIVQWLKGQHD